jgi:integrase
MHTLTLDQVTAKLLPAIAQDRLFAAIFLAFGTGLRRGELLALRWRDVDMKTGTLQVKQTLVRVTNHHVPKGEGRTQLIF